MRHTFPYLLLAVAIASGIGFALLTWLPENPLFLGTTGGSGHRLGPGTPPATEVPTPPVQTPAPPEISPQPEPRSTEPKSVMRRLTQALEKGDLETVEKLVAGTNLSPEARMQLAKFVEAAQHNPAKKFVPREVGERDLNRESRWELKLVEDEDTQERLLFDFTRKDNSWHLERLRTVPPAPNPEMTDPLEIADDFVQMVLNQKFEPARRLVDTARVSDAKIAALCILFEEEGYRLRPEKPLRVVLRRDTLVGFLANVLTATAGEEAQFSMTLERPDPAAAWQITEVNLDSLLADYAQRFSDGDVYYSPLLKNPAGGETLALYFDFDSDQLTRRALRQLEIVVGVLRADPMRRLVISGYTDALGTQDYNRRLSALRAARVRDFLVERGVSVGQITTEARGPAHPLRPNFKVDGSDNPRGRRANRRSEIYLDF